ncbi:MAG TPA: hypothetical protein VMY42_21275 [Thermoguttaceae bacterium]|nr:hypothetical protein [Thermoguttaceae bacterium]
MDNITPPQIEQPSSPITVPAPTPGLPDVSPLYSGGDASLAVPVARAVFAHLQIEFIGISEWLWHLRTQFYSRHTERYFWPNSTWTLPSWILRAGTPIRRFGRELGDRRASGVLRRARDVMLLDAIIRQVEAEEVSG